MKSGGGPSKSAGAACSSGSTELVSETLDAILGYHFTRPDLPREALTHRSALQGKRTGHVSNERLEFIGDRVLGLLIAEWLAERFPAEQEGQLGPRHAQLVSRAVLAAVGQDR